MPRLTPDADLCVIGGGEAGFTAAIAGAALGLKVVLVDPAVSDPCWRKQDVALAALRRAARAIGPDRPDALARFRADLRAALGRAAPDRRFARLEAMNVRLWRGRARFRDPETIVVDGTALRARRSIVATGAPIADPSDTLLARLLGPDPLPDEPIALRADERGLAWAQGLRRLGCRVALPAPALDGWDTELLAPLHRVLLREGILFDEQTDRLALHATSADSLGLAAAGIDADDRGLVLSPALRTSNRRVYAAGAAAGARSTAETQAQVATVMKSAVFRLPVRHDPSLIPCCIMTDPAIAAVGLSEAAAGRAGGPVTVWRWPYAETAAGSAEPDAPGLLKVVADRYGRVVGAGIVHPAAAELIAVWSLAVQSRRQLASLAQVAVPAGAFADASRRIATLAAVRRLQSPWLKRALDLLARLP